MPIYDATRCARSILHWRETASVRDHRYKFASTQKCPELIPLSPSGLNVGRGKWASAAVVFCSVDSVTTPSSWDEAHPENRDAISTARIAHSRAAFFTETNVLIAEPAATPIGRRATWPQESPQEKILRVKRSSRLVLHGRRLGRA